MLRAFLGLSVLAVWAGAVVAADEKKSAPQGPPPMQALARMDRDGLVEIQVPVGVPVMPERRGDRDRGDDRRPAPREDERRPPPREDDRRPAGRGDERPQAPPQFRTEMQSVRFNSKDVQAYSVDGKKLDANALRDRLARETPVLISGNGQKVDPFYLRVVKEDTLVLLLPPPREGPAKAPPPKPEPRRERQDR
jgi:hypothetical protein